MHHSTPRHILLALAISCIFFSINFKKLQAQRIDYLSTKNTQDSSYYDLLRIGPNEFWAGGENGTLAIIDSNGIHHQFSHPLGNYNILKMIKKDNQVLIFTDDAVVFVYDLNKDILTKKYFDNFKNRCFYDAICLDDGSILLCGGSTGIAKHKKVIPNGYIALMDKNLDGIKTLWHSKRKFVWHMTMQQDRSVFAAVFNGINSTIYLSRQYNRWKKFAKIPGLVHEIFYADSMLYYSGSSSIKYRRYGTLGSTNIWQHQRTSGGCIWNLEKDDNQIIGSNQDGELIVFYHKKELPPSKKQILPKAIYDLEVISHNKWLAVGHGQTIAILSSEN